MVYSVRLLVMVNQWASIVVKDDESMRINVQFSGWSRTLSFGIMVAGDNNVVNS